MSVRAIYWTDAFTDRRGKTGTETERSFPSLDEAIAAKLPKGYTFGLIPVKNGHYVYHSAAFEWVYHPAASGSEFDQEIEETTAEEVEKCVDDWLKRLDDLFKKIKDWAVANGWTVENGPPIPMHEEMMERFGVAGRSQPTLSVRSDTGAQIWIQPKGLWVIGANGRVDMYSPKGAYALVDVGEKFQTPRWILYFIGNEEGKPFDPRQLADMV